jgi:hypothetical protein
MAVYDGNYKDNESLWRFIAGYPQVIDEETKSSARPREVSSRIGRGVRMFSASVADVSLRKINIYKPLIISIMQPTDAAWGASFVCSLK